MDYCLNIIANQRITLATSHHPTRTQPHSNDNYRQTLERSSEVFKLNPAGTLFEKYKDQRSKFKRAITDSWSESVYEYASPALALRMNQKQKLDNLPIILKGDARQYFKDHVKANAHSYELAISLIDTKFNSIANKHRIKTT